MEYYPLFAFGIANLPMLGWLAAAAAPVVIHLLSRRRYAEVSWAAMEYLLAAVKKQRRRLRFEQWLLLAVRTLIVVLLVLAVAEPYFQRTGPAPAGAGRIHRVLVLDGSFSMAYRPTDRSRFEQAKQLAGELVEESRRGDAFTLVLMASPPAVVIGAPAMEPGEVLGEIDRLKCTDTTIDGPATVDKVRRIVQNARRENPGLGRHEVYFLTDLQRVGWEPNKTSEPRGLSPRRTLPQDKPGGLLNTATIAVIDLGQPDAENLAVADLSTLDPVATLAADVRFEVCLKNFGRKARNNQPIELLIDRRRVARKHIDIAAGEERSVEFTYRFDTPGDHIVEVRADGDALPTDNRRFMVVPVRESLRVLCIDGRPSGEPFGGAADYLAAALSPAGDSNRQTSVQVDLAPESALIERDLGQYDCVFICNVAQFTAGEARVMDAYLGAGGNVVFFLGEAVTAQRYNRRLYDTSDDTHILPARLGEIVPAGVYHIDPMEYRHPIVRAFRGREKAGLSAVPIFRYFKLTVPKDSGAMVVLKTTQGDPLIVEASVGRGRVVLVGASADVSWTPLPLWPSFVPLVQEMLAFCAGGELRQRNVAVGEPIVASVPSAVADLSASVHCPDGRTQPVTIHTDGDCSTLSFDGTTVGGIYTVRLGEPIERAWNFAANIDTTESNLARITIDQLRRDLWPEVVLLKISEPPDLSWDKAWRGDKPHGSLVFSEQQPGMSIAQPARLHVYLLYVVLGLLLTETCLAWRYGYNTP